MDSHLQVSFLCSWVDSGLGHEHSPYIWPILLGRVSRAAGFFSIPLSQQIECWFLVGPEAVCGTMNSRCPFPLGKEGGKTGRGVFSQPCPRRLWPGASSGPHPFSLALSLPWFPGD